MAFTPSLVRTPEELTAANVLASGVENLGLFAGAALGAVLLVLTGSGTVLAVTAGLSLVSVVLVALISIALERASDPSRSRGAATRARSSAVGERSPPTRRCGS